MTTARLTRDQAIGLFLRKQRLTGPRPARTPAGLLEIARSLRCLQIDPTKVVAPTQYLVWWSRAGSYDRAVAERLLWDDRSLFHYWAHAASLVLTEDFPIHRTRMRAYATDDTTWGRRVRTWIEDNDGLRRHILSDLRRRGPLTSRDFEDRSEKAWASEGWTGGRNVSRMLDFLWVQGKVLISGRQGGQRVWDLADRFLPADTPKERIGRRAASDRAARFALSALGVAPRNHLMRHFIRGEYIDLQGFLDRGVRSGEIERVEVEGAKVPWYMLAEDRSLLRRRSAPRTTLLSPFDNLICDRERTLQLFDFDYKIEIYTPKDKRRYGYFSLPILHEDRLIGRLDPALDRKTQTLRVRSLHLEDDRWADSKTAAAVGAALADLATFVGASSIEAPPTIPRGWRSAF